MQQTEVMFFGTTACVFDRNEDTPCFLVNQKYLFDTGWALVPQLVNHGFDPLEVKYLFFTHMHHDHYISLPGFLFYYLQCGGALESLHIIGPEADVERVVMHGMQFLDAEKFYGTARPTVHPLKPGDTFETEDMRFETTQSVHPVQGLCYRMTDLQTGRVICATGDTTRSDLLAPFFRPCDLLIHEVSLGLCEKPIAVPHPSGHSAVQEAVALANTVGAKQLFFVHHPKKDEAAFLQYAKAHLHDTTPCWPRCGVVYRL